MTAGKIGRRARRMFRPRTIFSGAIILGLLLIFQVRVVKTDGYRNLMSSEPGYGGDEPRYLRMAYSLVKDGDLDLKDLVTFPEERKKIEDEARRLGSHGFAGAYVVGVNGGIYSFHMPGFSAFIAPAFRYDVRHSRPDPLIASSTLPFLPSEMTATRLWLTAAAFLTILLLFRLMDHFFKSLLLAGAGLLLFILWSPFPGYAFQMYPEMTGALFALLAFNALAFPFPKRWMNDISLVVGISALPWLHQRFIPLAAGLALGLVLFPERTRMTPKRLVLLGLCFLVMSLPYFYYFHSITGNPLPTSLVQKAYGGTFAHWNILPLGFFGNLFHGQWGMLWAYPWFVLVLFGLYQALASERKNALLLLTPAVPYYLMCSAASPWFGAAVPPGRFLVALFPFLVIFAVFAVRDLVRRPNFRRLWPYAFWGGVIGLNLTFKFERFDVPFKNLSGRDLGLLGICGALILAFYLSLFLNEKFASRRDDSPP
jgi:hypothetical protein